MSIDNSSTCSEKSSKLGRKQALLEEERKREDCDNNRIIAMNETDAENYEDTVTKKEEGSTKINVPKRKKYHSLQKLMMHVL